MRLKKANIKDSNFFYNLRNDKQNRVNYVNSKFINYKDHKNWFRKALTKEIIYKINFKKIDCGYIRLERVKKNYLVSICIQKKFRKKNIASKALSEIEKKVPINSELRAIVKKNNFASKNLFDKLGYFLFMKNKKYLIMKKNNNKIKIIDQIESIRGKNNVNWMDLLRLAYKKSPKESATIMSKIYRDDSKISKLVKKLIR
jgi:ribosomal protein S18 acetylase RimI-like enzyme